MMFAEGYESIRVVRSLMRRTRRRASAGAWRALFTVETVQTSGGVKLVVPSTAMPRHAYDKATCMQG